MLTRLREYLLSRFEEHLQNESEITVNELFSINNRYTLDTLLISMKTKSIHG